MISSGMPALSAIREAQVLLKAHFPVTRLVHSGSLSRLAKKNVYLKLESELPTGSFKPRGALYALSVNLQRRAINEVVAASTGNHGAAVAFAARVLGVHATIFLPKNANPVKQARIAELGATIVEHGRDIAEAFDYACAQARAEGVFFLNDSTDPDLPAGPATIALEIFEQIPATDTIYVPMGDTALIRAVASAARQIQPKTRIMGVQAERAPSYVLSWKQGTAVPTDTCDTIADGLATRTPDPENVRAIRELVDDVRLVSEEKMLHAIRHLLLEEHLVAEPAGAATTAAFLAEGPSNAQNIVLLVTGCNVDPQVLRRALCG